MTASARTRCEQPRTADMCRPVAFDVSCVQSEQGTCHRDAGKLGTVVGISPPARESAGNRLTY